MNSFVPIGAACLVCLMPLALYFLYLSYLHQRGRPTMLSGPWDFACALLGLSGFLLMGGLMMLSLVDSTWRSFWFHGGFSRIRDAWHSDPRLWSILGSGYVVLLALVLGLLLRGRRRWTAIYNADRAMVEEILIRAIDHLGRTWKRTGTGLEIGIPKEEAAFAPEFQPMEPPLRIRIESFESLNHVHLRWLRHSPALLRSEVQGEMEKVLSDSESAEGSVAGWFLTAAVSIFFVMLLWMIFLIYTVMSSRR